MRNPLMSGLIALAFAAGANADTIPLVLPHQGRLVDASDVPVEDSALAMTFELHDTPDSSLHSPLWTESKTVPVVKGAYAVVLGETTPIPTSILEKQRVFVSVTIGGRELLPRMRLGTVAYALRAANADHADVAAKADDADMLGGKAPAYYATAQSVTELAAQVTSGALTQAVADARYLARDADVTTTGAVTARSYTTTGAVTAGSFIGSGSGLTGVPSSALTGAIDGDLLPSDLARTGTANTFGAANTFSAATTLAGTTALNGAVSLGSGATLALASRPVTGFRAENADTPPVACNSGNTGYIFFDTKLGAFRGCNGSEFVAMQTISSQIVKAGLIQHLDAGDTNSYGGTGSVWKDVSGASNGMGNANLNTGDWSWVSGATPAFRNTTASANGGIEVQLANFSKQEGTLEMWIKPSQWTNSNGLFVNRSDSTANAADWLWFGIYGNGSSFYLRIGDGSACCGQEIQNGTTSTFPPLNQWSQVFATWSNAGKISREGRNGLTIATRALSNIPNSNPSSVGRLGIGHVNGDAEFLGDIAIVRFYNRALGDAELAQNFAIQRARFGL